MSKRHYSPGLAGLLVTIAACAAVCPLGLAADAPANTGTAPAAAPSQSASRVIADLAKTPSVFAFSGWQDKTQAVAEGLRIKASDARGGLTFPFTTDLSAFAESTPRLTITVGPKNKLTVLVLVLTGADETKHTYRFTLEGLAPDRPTALLAAEGASLREPSDATPAGQTLNLAKLKSMELLGTWWSQEVDITLGKLELVPPDAEILKQREALRVRVARDTEAKRAAAAAEAKRRADFLAQAPHPADGASVRNIGAVAQDILGIEIQSGEYKPGAMLPYAEQPGDTLTGGTKAWIVRDGKMIEELVGKEIRRKNAQGKEEALGVRSYDGKWYFTPDSVAGTPLELLTIEEPAAYEITSADDPAYSKPVKPAAVYRKSKPNSPATGGGAVYALRHRLYLKLPAPLQQGATYTVQFKGINTREPNLVYKHQTQSVRSDAVHVTHLGYRPDDPFKRGYLSLWLGTGGSYEYANVNTFEVVDAKTGKAIFTGKVQKASADIAKDDPTKEYTLTSVYTLDFSALRTPGEYRVHVPGIGSSYPFAISNTVWSEAFKLGMRGVLSQRSGIALGPPFLDFKRPRPSHPDDGVKFYQIDANDPSVQEEGRGEALLKLWRASGKLEEVTGLWGGYQDAGDWDTYSTTLETADMLTEAFEVSPEFGKRTKLSLPPEEAGNTVPDLLDEAIWGLAAYRRLQLPSGAVRAGYGDGWGVRPGDVSWIDSNPVCVYAASTDSSWHYASIAARMARLLAPYDTAQAKAYGESAAKAWAWAEAQTTAPAATAAEDRKDRGWLRKHAREAAAAVALYQLTREQAYHDRYKQICETLEARDTNYAGGWIEPLQQASATFWYARLSDDLADPKLKENARKLYVLAGNVAVQYMKGNPYNIATVNSGYPMGEFCAYFTCAGTGLDIVRAHAVTGDPRYLEAIVASTGFGLGANPENMAFTTGIGPNPVQFPLKLDNRSTGQPAPVGITVYGPSDQRTPKQWSGWVYQWVLTPTRMVPNAHTWPPAESYVDVFAWPAVNEYCVNTPLTATVYTWYYLAARP